MSSRSKLRSLPIIVLALALSGCNRQADQSGAGGITAGEAQALDDAAEMIEAKRLPEAALRPPAASPASPAAAPAGR